MESPVRHAESEWLDFAADLMCAPRSHLPDEEIIRRLVETFIAPAGGYYFSSGESVLQQRTWPEKHFGPHRAEIEKWTAHEAPVQHPLLRYYLATGDSRTMQVDDVPTRFADSRIIANWRELGRRWGDVTAQISLPVSMQQSRQRAFLVGRSDPFTFQEMDLARRLQRLLIGLDRQTATYSRWEDRSGPDATNVAAALRLTPRELGVLDLLADGLTAASIGRRLHISERTVHKHLQRCYAKLGVSDRLTAVRRANRIGLLAAYRDPRTAGGVIPASSISG